MEIKQESLKMYVHWEKSVLILSLNGHVNETTASSKKKVLPRPSPFDIAPILPPCSSMIAFETKIEGPNFEKQKKLEDISKNNPVQVE